MRLVREKGEAKVVVCWQGDEQAIEGQNREKKGKGWRFDEPLEASRATVIRTRQQSIVARAQTYQARQGCSLPSFTVAS